MMIYCLLVYFFALIPHLSRAYKAEQIVRLGPDQDLQCAEPLISSEETFPDSSFSSSSVWKNATDFQPFRARWPEVYANKEHTSGYAWCPDSNVKDSLTEWIQAEFSNLVIISTIFTVGRGEGNVKEFMPNFVLRYQREDSDQWYEHVKSDGTRVLKANNDPRNMARTTLDSVVIAKRIRIFPYTHHAIQHVCLRFALFGCNFPDGVVTYSMLQGDHISHSRSAFDLVPPVPYSFQDLTYDGELVRSTNHLANGLGQLMDNVAYLNNVTSKPDSHPNHLGFHFVGWKSRSNKVDIVFKFDQVRNFSWIRLFTFDSIPLHARLFARATLEFSLDGLAFGKSIEFLTGRARLVDPGQFSQSTMDKRMRRESGLEAKKEIIIYSKDRWDGAMVVQIPMQHHVGQFVRLTLIPSDEWIFLSEVQFNSTIVDSTTVKSLYMAKTNFDKVVIHGDSTKVGDGDMVGHVEPQPVDAYQLNRNNETNAVGAADSSAHYPKSVSSNLANDPKGNSVPTTNSRRSYLVGDPMTTHVTRIIAIVAYTIVGLFSACLLLAFVVFLNKRKRKLSSVERAKRFKQQLMNGNGTAFCTMDHHSLTTAYHHHQHHHPHLVSNNNNNGTTNAALGTTIPEAAHLLIPYSNRPTDTSTNMNATCTGANGNLVQFMNANSSPNSDNNNNNGNGNANNTNLNIVNNNNGLVDMTNSIPNGTTAGALLMSRLATTSCGADANSTESDVKMSMPTQSILLNPNSTAFGMCTINGSNMYTSGDVGSLGGMSPEYASASIFGFTPPPSEPQSITPVPLSENPFGPTSNNNNNRPITPPFVYPLSCLTNGGPPGYGGPMPSVCQQQQQQQQQPLNQFASPNFNVLLLPQNHMGLQNLNGAGTLSRNNGGNGLVPQNYPINANPNANIGMNFLSTLGNSYNVYQDPRMFMMPNSALHIQQQQHQHQQQMMPKVEHESRQKSTDNWSKSPKPMKSKNVVNSMNNGDTLWSNNHFPLVNSSDAPFGNPNNMLLLSPPFANETLGRMNASLSSSSAANHCLSNYPVMFAQPAPQSPMVVGKPQLRHSRIVEAEEAKQQQQLLLPLAHHKQQQPNGRCGTHSEVGQPRNGVEATNDANGLANSANDDGNDDDDDNRSNFNQSSLYSVCI